MYLNISIFKLTTWICVILVRLELSSSEVFCLYDFGLELARKHFAWDFGAGSETAAITP